MSTWKWLNLLVVFSLLMTPSASSRQAQEPEQSLFAPTTNPRITLTAAGFDPQALDVQVGETVEWYNATGQARTLRSGMPFGVLLPVMTRQAGTTQVRKDLTPRPPSDQGKGRSLSLFPGVHGSSAERSGFGGVLPPGGVFTHTFTTGGTFPYYLVEAPRLGGKVLAHYALDAPPLDPTVATNLCDAVQFLFSGLNPLQIGVAPDTIDCQRVSVLRGRVMTRDETPLEGVKLTILDHPEYGYTFSRADGMFDLAVNGGGLLTVDYRLEGYLPAQRQVSAPWQDYAWLPDVALVPLDTKVTTIDLDQTAEDFVVAQGSVVTDEDGLRQATLLFAKGTGAEMTLPGGATQALTTLSVRATEFTVGENGPEAMPAELPATTGYTYAAEFSADEALSVGATDIQFDKPVYFYQEDFIGFPVGSAVPTGYYDRETGQWVASENGRVVKIIDVTSGLAGLDTDGDGVVDNGQVITPTMVLTITVAERQKLATLYPNPPVQLWRVPVQHFTPWDCNWPYGPPEDAEAPDVPDPEGDDPEDDPCEKGGSIVECQNQVLGEQIPVAGTPFTLNYRSNRVPGRLAAYSLKIPLSGDSLPDSLKGIRLEVVIAGRKFIFNFSPQLNLVYTFTWDGKDAFGRTVQGSQPISVSIGYVYEPVYYPVRSEFEAAFGRIRGGSGSGCRNCAAPPPISGGRQSNEIVVWKKWYGIIRPWDARSQELGGWTLDIHHLYDVNQKTLLFGDGSNFSDSKLISEINTIAGNGDPHYGGDGGPATSASLNTPSEVEIAPDGSLYIADYSNHSIRKVAPDGIITTVAGKGTCYFGNKGDGGLATAAEVCWPYDIALMKDGSLLIAVDGYRIRRVGLDGKISTVAGTGSPGYSGDGGLATQAKIGLPTGIEAVPDGSYLFTDESNDLIRRVGPDGIISTIAGTGSAGYSGDGNLATLAQLNNPSDVALGPDGSVFISDSYNRRIRHISLDGIITTIAGNGQSCLYTSSCGDGGKALDAELGYSKAIWIDKEGVLYSSEENIGRVRRVSVDGYIDTVVGGGSPVDKLGDGGLPTAAKLNSPRGVTGTPSGCLIVSDSYHHRVRQVCPPLPGFSIADIVIPSRDGSEIYHFNPYGRHLRTLHALTGAVLYTFNYDSTGRLITMTDGDNNVTSIERNTDGNPVAIVGPYGQRTNLALNENGYLASITNPAGEAWKFEYTPDGLLTQSTQPGGQVSQYEYDELGRLARVEDPAGGFKTLARTALERTEERQSGYEVTLTTALGRTTTYRVEQLNTTAQRITNIFPDGTSNRLTLYPDGTRTVLYADGTLVTEVEGPDPRWGMLAPWITSIDIQTPQGLHFASQSSRTAEMADPNDPFSLETLTTQTIVNGRKYTSEYNASLRQASRTTPAGRIVITYLDERGRITGYRVADLAAASYSYDSYGRLVAYSVGEGNQTRTYSLDYNALGYLESYTDPLGRTWTIQYNNAGRITHLTLPGDNQVGYSYDPNGKVLTLTPPGRPAHAFTYTPDGQTASYDPPNLDPGQDQTRFEYNLDGQDVQLTRPDGKIILFEYEANGKKKTVTLPDGLVNYTYDPTTGRLATLSSPDELTLGFDYDGAFLTQETWSGPVAGSVERKFNTDLWLSEESVNAGQAVAYQYDPDGLITRAGELNLERAAASGLITGTELGILETTQAYNSFGELQEINAKYGDTALYTVQYIRDLLGRVTQASETVQGVTHVYTYSYDPAGRLTAVTRDGTSLASYTYDTNGNRLSYSGQRGSFSATYDAQDRLVQYGAATFTYTANGELLTRNENSQVTTYDYDASGNLNSATLPDGTQVSYLSDARNRLVGKKMNGALVQAFLYRDLVNPVAELDGAGNVVSRFVYGTHPLTPDYMLKGGKTYRLVNDPLGSVRLVVDVSNGAVVQRIDYDEFGVVLADTNPGFQPFGFAGGLYDGHTHLTRFGFRDYDASIGRWTAKDPLGFGSGQMNWYSYTAGDPLNQVDPLGLHADPCGRVNWGNMNWEQMNQQIEKLKAELDRASKEYEKYKPEFDAWEKQYQLHRVPREMPFWDKVASLVAGFGDQFATVPFIDWCLTCIVRDKLGISNSIVDKSSDWYEGGYEFSTAWDWAMFGMGAVTAKGPSTYDFIDFASDLTSGEE